MANINVKSDVVNSFNVRVDIFENHGTELDPDAEILESYDLQFPFSSVSITRKVNPETPLSYSLVYLVQEPVLSQGLEKMLQKILSLLSDSFNPSLFDFGDSIFISPDRKAEREKHLRNEVLKILDLYSIRLPDSDFDVLFYFIRRNFLDFGCIQPFLEDRNIEDISGNGYGLPVYIFHKKYGSVETNVVLNEQEADALVRRMAQCAKKQISVAKPMIDAALPDGSRVQLSLGNEITTKGSSFTIRKFEEKPLSPFDLVANRTFSPEVMAYLELCVESGMSLMFAGGTASGKTTSMNAVCRFIPLSKKIVSIEDTREINLPHRNWISGVSRDAPAETAGQISLYDLLKSALRQRPEYILVGEIRGSEAYVLFQAMSTGHATLSTMHAESVDTLIHRLENPPMNVPRAMIQTLDVLIILSQIKTDTGSVRKCLYVYEILETDPQTSEILTQEIFNAYRSDAFDLEKSSVLKRIQERRGWTTQQLTEEFDQRVRSLQNNAGMWFE
ncbi:hypothetical protein MsAg5_10130 [Methanosarcinaceae archaeon Ag5]|uniref:Bacterial type II secretion system protein E domain-containing protein n=1 Tax=Methanolapillus africanus TaxID=3028297 RepID=A0AAE4ML74_9EURY|nr:hypothetical protein [Methanosarcinaceae archaeon Ag5]